MLTRRTLAFCGLMLLTGCSRRNRLSSKSIDEIKSLIQGKSAKEVLALLGKPSTVNTQWSDADEGWNYRHAATHPATGNKMSIVVMFRGGQVVDVRQM